MGVPCDVLRRPQIESAEIKVPHPVVGPVALRMLSPEPVLLTVITDPVEALWTLVRPLVHAEHTVCALI